MRRYSNLSEWVRRYRDDERRIKEEVWSVTNVLGKVVLDVGVGESTAVLKHLGAKVVGVECDANKVSEYSYLGVPIIVCDFLNFPC